jgi:cytosine deaminase
LEGYGIAPGKNADLVVLQAADAVEAIRVRATRLLVMRRGKVVAETPPQTARLNLAGRPESADFLRGSLRKWA